MARAAGNRGKARSSKRSRCIYIKRRKRRTLVFVRDLNGFEISNIWHRQLQSMGFLRSRGIKEWERHREVYGSSRFVCRNWKLYQTTSQVPEQQLVENLNSTNCVEKTSFRIEIAAWEKIKRKKAFEWS